MVGSVRAGVIVALNANERAPIFEHADVCIVGDWRETLPALVEALEGKL
jgi:electron transfer flavoprotein alpha subunit